MLGLRLVTWLYCLLVFIVFLETALICVGRKKKLLRNWNSEKTVSEKEPKPAAVDVKTEGPSTPVTPAPAFSISGTQVLLLIWVEDVKGIWHMLQSTCTY